MSRFISLLLVLLSASAQAENLSAIYQQALNSDPELKSALAGHRAQLLNEDKATALLLPTVTLSTNTSRKRQKSSISNPPNKIDVFTDTSYNFNINQPILHYDAFILRNQAQDSIQQSSTQLAATQQAIMLKVAERYFDYLSAQANLDFSASEKKAIAKQLEQARKRFDVGLIAITDVHEAQSAYDLSVAAEIAAQNQRASAAEALTEITGNTHDNLDNLNKKLPLLKPQPEDMSTWTDIASKQNLQLKSFRLTTNIAKKEIRLQRAGHYPTLDIVASHNKSDTGGDFGRNSTTSSLALQLNVPIYQGGLINAQTKEAVHLYSQAQHNQDQQLRAVLRQTRDAYRGVISGISQVKALQQATVSSQSALETTQAGFDVGTRTIVDVLLAQRSLFQSIRNYDQARHQYIVNILRLKSGAGTLSPDDLSYFDQWLVKQ